MLDVDHFTSSNVTVLLHLSVPFNYVELTTWTLSEMFFKDSSSDESDSSSGSKKRRNSGSSGSSSSSGSGSDSGSDSSAEDKSDETASDYEPSNKIKSRKPPTK